MRLVDFLSLVLKAHGQSLSQLAALFGEAPLLEMLEGAGESPADAGLEGRIAALPFTGGGDPGGSPYAELEGAVQEIRLPAVLEFHLWAYPFYRAMIEGPHDLGSRISAEYAEPLIDEALSGYKRWLKKLEITPQARMAAEKETQAAWVRFQADVRKLIGKRKLSLLPSQS